MAAIDKTYLNWEDYLILKEWCENTELIYDNGIKGSPKDFLYSYHEAYEGELPVWNTSCGFDYWLYKNCPLSFIQKRLAEQYNDYFEDFQPKTYEIGKHYKYVAYPKYNFRDKRWNISNGNWYLFYGWESKVWYSSYALMPPEAYSSCAFVKNLTRRKLGRLIKKWKLPIGTVLKISNRLVGSDYTIVITK